MKLLKSMILASVVLATLSARAAVSEPTVIKVKNNSLISKVIIQELKEKSNPLTSMNGVTTGGNSFSLPEFNTQLDQVIMVTDKLIALGEKIWTLIEKGRPVVNTSYTPTFSVLPKGVQDDNSFDLMSGWSDPTTKSFRIIYKGIVGQTVASFKVSITTQFGGKDENGKGKYLSSVSVIPSELIVGYGVDFNAKTQLVSITNKGTRTDPIAGANIQIDYGVKSVFKSSSASLQFHVDGTGKIKSIN